MTLMSISSSLTLVRAYRHCYEFSLIYSIYAYMSQTAGITLILALSLIINHHELGHSIDFANSCVIYPESHMTKRKIAESLLISQQQQQVMEGNINSFRLRVFRH